MRPKKIVSITQLLGCEMMIDGGWRKIAEVIGPKKSQFGAAGSFYRVKFVGGYQDSTGRIYPDWTHVWRGDYATVRRVIESEAV